MLDYNKWENFSKVIDRAMLACKNSGFDIGGNFVDIIKVIKLGLDRQKEVADYKRPATPAT